MLIMQPSNILIFKYQNLINAEGRPKPNPIEAQRQCIRFSLLKPLKWGRKSKLDRIDKILTYNFLKIKSRPHGFDKKDRFAD